MTFAPNNWVRSHYFGSQYNEMMTFETVWEFLAPRSDQLVTYAFSMLPAHGKAHNRVYPTQSF